MPVCVLRWAHQRLCVSGISRGAHRLWVVRALHSQASRSLARCFWASGGGRRGVVATGYASTAHVGWCGAGLGGAGRCGAVASGHGPWKTIKPTDQRRTSRLRSHVAAFAAAHVSGRAGIHPHTNVFGPDATVHLQRVTHLRPSRTSALRVLLHTARSKRTLMPNGAGVTDLRVTSLTSPSPHYLRCVDCW